MNRTKLHLNHLVAKSRISYQIWKWEIINPDDPVQDSGIKLLNYCIVISPGHIEEVVDFARQINLEVDSDNVQELLDSHSQELTTNELIEMLKQEQVVEDIGSLDPVQLEDRIAVGNVTEGFSLNEKGFQILENINSIDERIFSTKQEIKIYREFDIAHSVVSRLWKSFKTTGMCSRRHRGGRVRSTTPAEDRYIVLSAKRNRRTTAQQHRTARLQWCREHHNWTEQDWACVLFSDESRFSLSSYCRRQLIWRESGTAYRPENIQEKDRYPTCSIKVWAGIMINGRTRLHVVANGTMTGQRYIDEVLLPHVRLFRDADGDKFDFMDDNATYLNPIENVWDALGRQVAGRNYPPTNKNTLIRALIEEWDKLPQQLLDNVVQSMVRRVECCITLHGGHVPY
ncbi:transposable element Tcb2 transposase [Trichonephila clavipes]|nr:transposable element Tcb2 transposase [Trichonephila clavipes]